MKFELKAEGVTDFKVPKLECLWDVEGPETTPQDQWQWRLLIRIPEAATGAHVRHAKKTVAQRKGIDVSAVSRRSWKEGKALQVMHVGPYEEIGHAYKMVSGEAERLGYRVRGPGHDVYISDPGRVSPDKLKTIVRLPISHARPAYARGRAE